MPLQASSGGQPTRMRLVPTGGLSEPWCADGRTSECNSAAPGQSLDISKPQQRSALPDQPRPERTHPVSRATPEVDRNEPRRTQCYRLHHTRQLDVRPLSRCSGHGPNPAKSLRQQQGVEQAMAAIRAATPGASSYVNEANVCEPLWKQELWMRRSFPGGRSRQGWGLS